MPKAKKPARVVPEGSQRAAKKSKAGAAKVPAPQPVEIASAAILKRLADNDEDIRRDALATVMQRLETPRSIEAFELQKLWKGLWFTMWHSDKPAVQQALARDLASMVGIVSEKNMWTFIDAFWHIFMREWETLDRHRVNKYLLLVRFMLNSILTRVLAGPVEWVRQYATSMVDNGPLNYTEFRYPVSLRLHLADIYVDEAEKVFEAQGMPKQEVLKLLFEPVLSQTTKTAFKPVKARVEAEVVEDERVVAWGLVERKEEAPAESSDSEWEGFD